MIRVVSFNLWGEAEESRACIPSSALRATSRQKLPTIVQMYSSKDKEMTRDFASILDLHAALLVYLLTSPDGPVHSEAYPTAGLNPVNAGGSLLAKVQF